MKVSVQFNATIATEYTPTHAQIEEYIRNAIHAQEGRDEHVFIEKVTSMEINNIEEN